jgi:4-alpha-glucanotransferase
MKILQFAFDGNKHNDHLPHNYPKNCVVYTGTHDNNTTAGWFQSLPEPVAQQVLKYLNSDGSHIAFDCIRTAWASVAYLAMAPMQDFLELGPEARMNFPGTDRNNWEWQMRGNALSDELATKIAELTLLYERTGE